MQKKEQKQKASVAVLWTLFQKISREKNRKWILRCMHEEGFPKILIQEYEIVSHIMGYRRCKSIWIPFVGEKLTCRMEPENALDTDAVAAMKNGSVVAHMMMTEKGKSTKTIFFLCPDKLNSCTAAVTGKAGQLTKRTGWECEFSASWCLAEAKILLKNYRKSFDTCMCM